MNNLYLPLIFVNLIYLATPLMANDNNEHEKNQSNTVYDLVNTLNETLTLYLHTHSRPGIEHISTFQKNKQIIIQVTHNPKLSYSAMIDNIAGTASRVNGVNFQNSFTLNIIDSYCKTDMFYTIQGEGLDKEVIVQYEDLKGNNIAQHRINKTLCHL